MKIGIVGPKESKWPEEKIPKANKQIYNIFFSFAKPEKVDLSDITLVSGRCHLGGPDIWSEDIADELGVKKEIYPPVCTQVFIETRKETRPATLEECQQLYNEKKIKSSGHFWQKHFRPRNIKIAEAFEVGFSIVPKINAYCWHCGKNGHPTNGGCYTVLKGKRMGKEVHIIEI